MKKINNYKLNLNNDSWLVVQLITNMNGKKERC